MATIPNTRGNPQASDIAVQTATSMIGGASREDLQTVVTFADAELAKLFEDRNITLTDGGNIAYNGAGTSVSFSEDLKLHINSKVAGGAPTIINLGSASLSVAADGRMIYALINRLAGTASIGHNVDQLPAVNSTNQEIVLLAKRVDDGLGTKRLYWRTGWTIEAGTTAKLGSAAAPTVTASNVSATSANGYVQSLSGNNGSPTLTPYSLYPYNSSTYTGADTSVRELLGGSTNYIAARFIPAAGTLSSSILRLDREEFGFGGPIAGNIFLELRADSSGSPGAVLATSNNVSAAGVSDSLGNVTFTFGTPYGVSSGVQYWLTLTGDATFLASTYANFSTTNNAPGPFYGYHTIRWWGNNGGGSAQLAKTSVTPPTWSAFDGFFIPAFQTFLFEGAYTGSTTISNLSSTTNIVLGAGVTGTGVQGGTTVTAKTATTVTISPTTTSGGIGITYTFTNPAHLFSLGDNVQVQLDHLDYNLRLRFTSIYQAIVGTSAQVALGYATHTSLATAISNAVATFGNGVRILILPNVTITENVTINNTITVEGSGNNSNLNGNLTVAGVRCDIRNFRVGGNLTLTTSGSFVRHMWVPATSIISDSGSGNSKLIIVE